MVLKSIVPYTKEIVFDDKIAEICSISLEHELDCKENEIEGNFIVSGEYRSHAVSVNKETFHYKLPFSVDVTESIIKDSIAFEITDFTYEILGDKTLKVVIEFMVRADEAPKEEVIVDEPERNVEDEEETEVREAVMEEINQMFKEEPQEEKNEKEEEVEVAGSERIEQESEELILDSTTEIDNEFATYHIHIINEEDTLESICAMYQTDVTTIKSYNDVETITAGDKIIIPCIDE